MSRPDTVVIGGGPAGAIAAALLARSGARVTIVDPPRPDTVRIGETLPAAAARLLQDQELPGHGPIGGVISRWGGPVTMQDALGDSGGPSWRLDRRSFDTGLLNAARVAGAGVIPAKVTEVARDGAGWLVTLDTGAELEVGAVVDASGRRAVLGRALGMPRQRCDPQVAVWAVGAAIPADQPATARTLIDAEPGGGRWWYGAVLPDRRPIAACHCSAAEAQHWRASPAQWHAALARSPVLGPRLPAALFRDAPLRVTDASGAASLPAAGAGWALCGDAAMAFDPLAAQGLLNAVRSGMAASSVLLGKLEAAAYSADLTRVWAMYRQYRVAHMARLTGALAVG